MRRVSGLELLVLVWLSMMTAALAEGGRMLYVQQRRIEERATAEPIQATVSDVVALKRRVDVLEVRSGVRAQLATEVQ